MRLDDMVGHMIKQKMIKALHFPCWYFDVITSSIELFQSMGIVDLIM